MSDSNMNQPNDPFFDVEGNHRFATVDEYLDDLADGQVRPLRARFPLASRPRRPAAHVPRGTVLSADSDACFALGTHRRERAVRATGLDE